MSHNKAIASGKEKRQLYRGAKAYVRSCRNHGGCPYCEDNRLHKFKRQQPLTFDEEFDMSNNEQQHPEYDEVQPPAARNWLDVTNPTDRMMGQKVYLNTLTQKVVSYPFNTKEYVHE